MDAGGRAVNEFEEGRRHDDTPHSRATVRARPGAAASSAPRLDAVAARYAVALPPALAELIDPNDPHDPIARQFVPDAAELDAQPEELADPIGDDAH